MERDLPHIAMIYASPGGFWAWSGQAGSRRAGLKFNQRPTATEDQI